MQQQVFLAMVAAMMILVTPYTQAGRRSTPIYTPQPIMVTGHKSLASVKKVIKRALYRRKWIVRNVSPGFIRATYSRGRHMAVVNVRYTPRKISIAYHKTESLNFNREKGTIHRTYNTWVQNMERDIRVELGAL